MLSYLFLRLNSEISLLFCCSDVFENKAGFQRKIEFQPFGLIEILTSTCFPTTSLIYNILFYVTIWVCSVYRCLMNRSVLRIRFGITFLTFSKLIYNQHPFDGNIFPCNTINGQNRCMFLTWVQIRILVVQIDGLFDGENIRFHQMYDGRKGKRG